MTPDISAVDLPTETLHSEPLVLRPYRATAAAATRSSAAGC
ncbi:hypothetical protein [Blastococcus sp. VKM Ac-2987]|nr:hypothetical protein [Blastococcus sp. VKM Ac-2987]MCZ2859593.1 hypothetical protein [Blastococcus sp. VKM Ac-2987]